MHDTQDAGVASLAFSFIFLFEKVHISLKENEKALHIAFVVLQLVFHYWCKDQSFSDS